MLETTIFVGLDVHKKTIAVATVTPDLNTACKNMLLSQHVRCAPARVTTTFWG